MPSDEKPDDSAARKARAEAIRRARDRRIQDLASGQPPAPPAPDSGAGDEPKSESESPGDDPPNYVDFIDRKMRQKKAPGS
jgi:hypothetical protein